jgi:formiminoglutamase
MFLTKEKINLKLPVRTEDSSDRRFAHVVKHYDFRADESLNAIEEGDIVLWGYPDDRGVERNYGRSGASEAPNSIRQVLYRLCLHEEKRIWDLGDFSAWSYSLSEAHERAASVVQKVRDRGALVVTLGGGHDWAYSDFKNLPMRLLNVDAHLDVRPQPHEESQKNHSGTPFRRLLEANPDMSLGVLGLSRAQNSLEHIKWAEGRRVQMLFAHELSAKSNPLAFIEDYFRFGESPFALSVDLDVFSQAFAPGVSAPTVEGIDPSLFFKFLRHYKKQIKQLGLYELCPRHDRDQQTARLAAQIVYEFLF